MSTEANPYLPPATPVADIPAAAAAQAPTFAVSIPKFVVMSFVTGGIYQFYWFYRHWQAVRRRTGGSIQPFWRAAFSLFWCYALLLDIDGEARRHGVQRSIAVGNLTAGWVILNMLSRLPDPWWLVSLLSFLFLVPVQRAANDLNAKLAPEADRNSRFTWANWLWLAVMSLFWALVLIALMLPPEALAS